MPFESLIAWQMSVSVMPPQSRRKDALLIQALLNPQSVSTLTLRQWDDLIRLARSSNMLSKLAERLVQTNLFDAVPEQPKLHLLSARILSKHQQQAIAWELNHIADALATIEVPLILLKGAAYVHAGLPVANGRLFGDVDILVPKADLPKVEATLMLHGWLTGESNQYNQRYYREWMHEIPPMINQSRGTVIDIHHNILPLTARPYLNPTLLIEQSRTVRSGSPFRVLSPCDMVIHSATHLFHESEFQNGLRDLFDLDSLLRHFAESNSDFWVDLVRRAQELGLSRPIYHAFRYGKQILGTPIPESAIEAISADAGRNRVSRKILDFAFMRALRPMNPLASDIWTPLARFILYLRGHMLRMPFPLLVRHLARKAFMRMFTASDPVES